MLPDYRGNRRKLSRNHLANRRTHPKQRLLSQRSTCTCTLDAGYQLGLKLVCRK